jgi:CelD/BcsL family acetyltransferase involved in cellulose biosynthesis
MTPPDRPAEAAANAPVVKRVPFNFRLGDLKLFSIPRQMAVLHVDSGTLPDGWEPKVENEDGCLVTGLRAPPDPKILAPRAGWSARVFRQYPRHLVDLTTGFDAYMAKFSGKTRSTLKRKLRKFHDLSGGATKWKQYRTRDEISEFLTLARALSQKTYQERLLDAGLPSDAAFTAEALARADRNQVRGFILFLDEKPISYLYLPIREGRVIYAYLGYDPSFAEHSPGTVLQLLAMDCLFAEPGLTVFDFTAGAGQHKRLFSTHSENCIDVLFVKRGSLTNVIAVGHSAFVRSVAVVTDAFDRVGIKSRLKRLLRGAAVQSDPK